MPKVSGRTGMEGKRNSGGVTSGGKKKACLMPMQRSSRVQKRSEGRKMCSCGPIWRREPKSERELCPPQRPSERREAREREKEGEE